MRDLRARFLALPPVERAMIMMWGAGFIAGFVFGATLVAVVKYLTS